MSGPLNLAHLESLVAVIDTGGFTRAARTLQLSQSTVSQHIILLENRLGTALIVRDARGIHLTPAGERLLTGARELLVAHDELVLDFTAPATAQVSIGSTEHAADRLLPSLIESVRSAYPDHRVTFTLDRSTELADAVDAGRLDLALTLALADDAPGRRVGSLPLRWLAAPAAANRVVDDPTVRLVAFNGACGIRELAVRRLRGIGRSAEIAVQSATLDGVVTATRAGLGVALLPILREVPAGLQEVAQLPEAGRVDVNLIARRGIDGRLSRAAADAVAGLLG
ncbi:MAG: LysR family transcriptional regulator [Gordonia sp. (in: high G+C Gram-positive bacteria)]|uniref:LysR family transcriptional regulator n=1 Tax=Gordonia sp. (in: high G+C Gram-positive bacteria) TaxID=84139 RepID=UPI0039E54185